MPTKKILVGFDPSKPEKKSSDFLAVVLENSIPKLLGIRSKKFFKQGLMVYLGKEITSNDIFAKLVNTGKKIDDVNAALQEIEDYIQQVQAYRIGNILTVRSANGGNCPFQLEKVAEAPPVKSIKLP